MIKSDTLARDALRLAVEYHARTYSGGGFQEQRDWMLRTADQFYTWLKAREEEER